MFRRVPLSIIRSFSLYIQTAMVYVIQVCWQVTALSKPVCIAVCSVKNSWWWTEELCETCRFLFQNKFEKSVYPFGFIIIIIIIAAAQLLLVVTVVAKKSQPVSIARNHRDSNSWLEEKMKVLQNIQHCKYIGITVRSRKGL